MKRFVRITKIVRKYVTPSLIINSSDDNIAPKNVLWYIYDFGFDSEIASFTTQ